MEKPLGSVYEILVFLCFLRESGYGGSAMRRCQRAGVSPFAFP